MYFEKKNIILLFFSSPEWMLRFLGWFKIDARHIFSDPIKLFYSHSNFSELTHIPTELTHVPSVLSITYTVGLRYRNAFEVWGQSNQTFSELSSLLLTLGILQGICESSQM